MVFLRGVLRITGLLLVLVIAPPAAYKAYALLTPYSQEALPPLRDGDILFQTIKTSQTLAVLLSTRSLYSHVGVVHMVDGEPMVIEAVGPVREIPLDRWVRQGIMQRVTIGRIDGLTAQQGRAVAAAARTYLGKPYDFFFLPGDDAIYCSELVHKAFASGAGIEVGKEQEIRTLYVDNVAVREVIRQRWQDYPPCKGSRDMDDCYATIMQQTLVSPASQRRDAKLKVIYSNTGF